MQRCEKAEAFSCSGEHRLPACRRRQLADESHGGARIPRCEPFDELFGRLPKRTGWQPVLPRTRSYLRAELSGLGFETRAVSRRKIVSPSFIRSRRSRATVSK